LVPIYQSVFHGTLLKVDIPPLPSSPPLSSYPLFSSPPFSLFSSPVSLLSPSLLSSSPFLRRGEE